MFARTVSADSTQQCAGHCQTNATYCNVFVFDDIKNICNLGTMGGKYNLISGQGDSFSHIDMGILKYFLRYSTISLYEVNYSIGINLFSYKYVFLGILSSVIKLI